jgi:hypothetical protein
MNIKLTDEEVAKLKELLLAKSEIYAQMKEMHHYAENFAVGIWQEQKKIEEKYNVNFSEGKHKLNLMTNEIEEVEEKKIIT